VHARRRRAWAVAVLTGTLASSVPWAASAQQAVPAADPAAGQAVVPTLPGRAPPVPPPRPGTTPADLLPGGGAPLPTVAPDRTTAIQMRLSSGLTFSDNIDLAAPGQEKSALVWTNGANVQAVAQSSRLSGALDYTLNVDATTAGDEKGVKARNELQALGQAMVVRDLAFIDADATVARRPTDTSTSVSLDPVAGRGNQDTVATVGISPYLAPRFGSWGSGELRYQYRRAFTDAAGVADPTSQLGRALLVSGERFSRLRVSLLGEIERTEGRGISADLDRDTGELRADYGLTTDLALQGMAGYEDLSAGSLLRHYQGVIWSVGATWQPTQRTRVSGSYGRRYGGNVFDVNVTWMPGPSTQLTASYIQRLYAGFDALAGESLSLDPNTGGFLSRTLDRLNPSLGFGIQEDAYHAKQADLSLSHVFGRNTVRLSLGREQRDYDVRPDERLLYATADWTRDINRRLQGRLVFTFRHDNGGRDLRGPSDTVGGRIEAKYLITADLDARVGFSHSRRMADLSGDRYRENAVFAALTYRF
jgi:uncharacterized protein (PEP-CTERM system associated)